MTQVHPVLAITLVAAYCLTFLGLAVFGAHRYWLVHRYFHSRRTPGPAPPLPDPLPDVLLQLPLYNERYVAERLLRAVGRMDYPPDRLTIQVLDDSTDDTSRVIEEAAAELRREGRRVDHVRRPDRSGYKAGALAFGLERSDAPYVAIFDADFIPPPDFLRRTLPRFADPRIGMVQSRWGHINAGYSLLTRIEAMMLDGHFVIEHGARFRSGCFFNFNGTAGVWRRTAIDEAGGWQGDTVTEDLDLSYRAQLAGWRFAYCPEVESPSELPVQMAAFKNQQHRWTKGASQTARKLLRPLWRSHLPFTVKLEGTFHLLGNVTYLLMVVLAVLLLPVYWLRQRSGFGWLVAVDLPMLIAGTFALASFYANAQRELRRSPWAALARLPLLMALGAGLALNNAWAGVEGWFRPGGEFIRTPKYRIESPQDSWRDKAYAVRRRRWLPVLEAVMLLYLAATLGFALHARLWSALPFLFLFVGGYGYIVALTAAGTGLARSGSVAADASPGRAS